MQLNFLIEKLQFESQQEINLERLEFKSVGDLLKYLCRRHLKKRTK